MKRMLPLVHIRSTMNALRYMHELLQPLAVLYLQWLQNVVFQQDKARLLIKNCSKQTLQGIQNAFLASLNLQISHRRCKCGT